MSWIVLLVIGIALVMIANFAGPHLPAPLPSVLAAIGWILIVVAILFLVLGLLGLSAGVGALR